MVIKEINVKEYLTKSNLPASDCVINPYIGCPHGCKYCYASFMKRFTKHDEEWGKFIDIKFCNKKIDLKKIDSKSVFLSSVTDCYNKFEEKYRVTRNILEQLQYSNCDLTISTKSSLILRDIDILKNIKNLTVSLSVNTLNEKFKNDMDSASSIKERLKTLKILYESGINTVLFMSPIFPYITEWKEIINSTKDYINEYWFENLNLRGMYKKDILDYIEQEYVDIYEKYVDIYVRNNGTYWQELLNSIEQYCSTNGVKYKNYFYHKELVENKKKIICRSNKNAK